MTDAFNRWWNSDGLVEDNPYERDTPAFWAWEGWQAALTKSEPKKLINVNGVLEQAGYVKQKEWQGLTDDEIKEILDCGRPNLINIKKAEQKLKEKNT